MILAIGQMMVILTRCIDLSVAANLALTGMIVAMLNVSMPDLPIPLIVLLSVLIGMVMGMINGLLVWKLALPSIVVTLGTMTIYRGTIFVISGGDWVNAHEMSDSFKAFARNELLGLPLLSWAAVLVITVFVVFMNRTPLGRALYAVGGNPHAAVYTGISVGRSQFWAFTLSGALAGLTGYLWVSRYAVAYVDIAGGFELEVVATCVIGGISIAGGIGTVGGAVLGALFLGIIKNALPVVNISPFWQLAISGSAILIAVALNANANANANARRGKGRIILRPVEQAT
jgi:rhamnose transport system permease protein